MAVTIWRCPRCRSMLQIEKRIPVLPGEVPVCRRCRNAPTSMTRMFGCNGYWLWVAPSWQ